MEILIKGRRSFRNYIDENMERAEIDKAASLHIAKQWRHFIQNCSASWAITGAPDVISIIEAGQSLAHCPQPIQSSKSIFKSSIVSPDIFN